jgi:hypothetical protein
MPSNIARSYTDLITASFHRYRFELHKLLHFDIPHNSTDEKEFGEKVTEYLWRGSTPKNGWKFKHPH